MHTQLLPGVALMALLVGSASSPAEAPDIDKEAEKKLLLAFGKDHKGVRDAKIKFQVKSGDHVFACDKFEVEADGWVKITPGYMAIFVKGDKNRLGNRWEAPFIRLQVDPPVKEVGAVARSQIKQLKVSSAAVEDFGKP